MGLDLVELVIRIEDTFSIQIPDRLASELTTPRKVADFILTQVEESPAPLPCLSQRAFHLLRHKTIQHRGLTRRQFHLHTAFTDILPEGNKDNVWKDIGSSVGSKKWPALTRSKWLFNSPKVQNVKEVVEYLVTNEPLLIKGGAESSWSRSQVREVLRRIIEDETGLTNFSEDSRFVEDMHLD